MKSVAERRGFEPRIGYEPIHAFQACDLNHSSISPKGQKYSRRQSSRSIFRFAMAALLRLAVANGSASQAAAASPAAAFGEQHVAQAFGSLCDLRQQAGAVTGVGDRRCCGNGWRP